VGLKPEHIIVPSIFVERAFRPVRNSTHNHA